MSIEYVAGDSPFHRMNPITKMVFFPFIMIVSLPFFLRDVISLSIILLIVVVFWLIARIPRLLSRFKALFLIVAGTVSIWVVAQGFFWQFSDRPIITFFEWYVFGWKKPLGCLYAEGLMFGLAMAIRIFAIFGCVPLLTLTTPIPKLVVALQRLRVPYKFNFTFSTAVRFAPLVFQSFYDIRDSQVLRAHDIDKMGYIEKIRRAFIPIVTPLFLSLLRRSDDLQISIESRAFGAPVKRTFVEESRFTYVDYAMIAFMIGFAILVAVGNLYWDGYILPPDWLTWLPWWARRPTF